MRPPILEYETEAHPAGAPPAQETRLGFRAEWFVGFLLVSQLVLLPLTSGPLRTLVRISTFGASLLLLVLIRGGGYRHPAMPAAVAAVIVVGASVFHPSTSTWLAGAAQAGMYLAILAPLFWVPRLECDTRVLRRAITWLWAFHSLSAALGVVQTYLPGVLDPPVSTVVMAQGEAYVESLRITNAFGQRVFRPMGLTDTPGGAASSGFYAVLFGFGLLLASWNRAWRTVAVLSIAAGFAAIYLSQVRSVLVMTAVCLLTAVALLLRRGELGKSLGGLVALGALPLAGYWVAGQLGGEGTARRVGSITGRGVGEVYYSSRGRFLEHTVEVLLPRYPFGAGMGRWGMMNSYFGLRGDLDRGMIWAEIQWTGWLLDGGVPLILAYAAMLVLAFVTMGRIAGGTHDRELSTWAILLQGYVLGIVALTFNYPVFNSQLGMEFWFLNALAFAAWAQRRRAEEPA